MAAKKTNRHTSKNRNEIGKRVITASIYASPRLEMKKKKQHNSEYLSISVDFLMYDPVAVDFGWKRIFDGHTKTNWNVVRGSKHYESLITTAGYSI